MARAMPWLLGKRDRFLEEPMAQQNKRECVAYGGGGPHFSPEDDNAMSDDSVLGEVENNQNGVERGGVDFHRREQAARCGPVELAFGVARETQLEQELGKARETINSQQQQISQLQQRVLQLEALVGSTYGDSERLSPFWDERRA